MNSIRVDGTRFVDELGRERIFYGINFGSKGLPMSEWLPDFRHINDIMIYLKNHGINLIRYYVNWSYIEPEPKKYDEKVISYIRKFLDICGENNVYVILDMHQDLYTAHNKSCGDGAPAWACVEDGYSFHKHKFVWAEGYFKDKSVAHCFDNFWNNTEVCGKGLQEHFCDLWRLLTSEFGNHKALLGFDLFNEPHPGTVGNEIFSNIVKSLIKTTLTDSRISKKELISALGKKDIIPNILDQYDGDVLNTITSSSKELLKKFDREKYMPFVNRVSSAIREINDRPIIFFEHSYFSNLGIPFSGEPVSIYGSRDNNQCFSPHGYDLFVDTKLYKYAHNGRVSAIFNQRRAEQTSTMNIPILVGEWGGGYSPYDWISHADFLLDTFDSYKWSHCYWCFHPGIVNSPIMDMLCRTHPVAVNGEICNYRFDKSEQRFTMSYINHNDSSEPTVIFCHRKIRAVSADCRYEINSLGADTYELLLYSESGSHTVNVEF